MEVIIALLYFVLPFVIWAHANKKGRCGFCWFVFSWILSPFILGIVLLILPPHAGQIYITE